MQLFTRFIKAFMLLAALCVSISAFAGVKDLLTVTPTEGTVDVFPDYIDLTVSDGTIKSGSVSEKIVLYCSYADDKAEAIDLNGMVLGTNRYRISFPSDKELPKAAGYYMVEIPEGKIIVNGEPCEMIDLEYFIEATDEPEEPDTPDTPGEIDYSKYMSVSPAAGVVTELSEWTISFAGEWGLEDRKAKFVVTAPDGVTVPAVYSYSNSQSFIAYLADDVVFTAPGTYTFTVPAGKFFFGAGGNVLNEEMVITYTIEDNGGTEPEKTVYDGEVYIDPSNNSRLDIIDMILLEYPDATEIVEGDAEIKLLDFQGKEIPVMVFIDENYVQIMVDNENNIIVDPGKYTVEIPQGAFVIDGLPSAALNLNYTIVAYWQGEYTVDPENDSVLKSLKNIRITFEGAKKVELNEFPEPNDFPTIMDMSTWSVIQTCLSYAEDNVLEIMSPSEITSPGRYCVMIPNRFFTVDGLQIDGYINLFYDIEGQEVEGDFSYELTPADGSTVPFDASFSINFTGKDIVSVANNEFASFNDGPHFTNNDGNYNPSLRVSVLGKVITLTLAWPFEANGEYTLIIPANYFTFTTADGASAKSEEIKATYKVDNSSSVTSISIDGSDAVIYNINGMRVNGSALPAGIYVKDGRKIIVK